MVNQAKRTHKGAVYMSTSKELVIPKITKCDECPYCQYDGYYSIGTDSGYDCKKINKRIIDEGDTMIHKNGINVYKNEPIKIPDWCPLPDNDEKVQFT